MDSAAIICMRRMVFLLVGLVAGAGLAIGLTDLNPASAQVDPAPTAEASETSTTPLAPDQTPPGNPSNQTPFHAASSAEHLWIARPQGNRFNLLHQNPRLMPDRTMRTALSEVMAQVVGVISLGDSAILVYRDNSVQAVQFTGEPDMQGSRYTVAQRASLPHGIRFIDTVTFKRTPVVLVRPATDETGPRPQTTPAEPTNETAPSFADTATAQPSVSTGPQGAGPPALQLLQLRAGQWQPIALPDALPDTAKVNLARLDGTNSQRLLLIVTVDGEDRVTVFSREADQAWTSRTHDLPDAMQWRLVGVDRHLVAVREAQTGTLLQARALLADRQVELGTFDPGDLTMVHWQPLGWSEQLMVLGLDAQGRFAWAQRDLAAPPDSPTGFVELPAKDWPLVEWDAHMVMMLLMLIAFPLIMLLSLRRPPQANLVVLPEGMQATALGRRFAAAAIDFAPALLVAMIATGMTDPTQILRNWPSLHTQWDAPQAGLYTIALFVGSTCMAELISGATLGKRIMRCRIVDNRGQTAKRGQILIRNAMKIMELLAFLLLILPLLSRHRQRLGDLVARTVVVDTHRHPSTQDQTSTDHTDGKPDPTQPDRDTPDR